MTFVLRLIISAVALWVTVAIVPGVDLTANSLPENLGTLVAVALIFGVVNAIVKPLVQVLGCALYVVTLGLFALVVNALLFMLTAWLANLFRLPFFVESFWPAFWGAIVMAVVTWLLSLALPERARD